MSSEGTATKRVSLDHGESTLGMTDTMKVAVGLWAVECFSILC